MIMDVEVRPAEPDDVDAAVPLIYGSGPHEYDFAFASRRHRATDWIGTAFLAGSTTEGYRAFQVALVDGRVVGVGSFVDGAAFNLGNSLRLIWLAMSFYGLLECWGAMRRTIQLTRQMPPPANDALFIQKLAVSPEMRGQGVGTALINEEIRLARDRGIRRCVLDVAVTNPKAQELYERLGFRVTSERSLNDRVPDQRRMELVL
jgi:ribosomal protein S18 acetylase RimI-like enzyme